MITFKKLALALVFVALGSLSFTTYAQTSSAGQLINLNGTVYLVGTTGLYGFPNLATFNSWGFTLSQLATATSAESSMSMVGLVPVKISGCDTPLNQINGSCSSISGSVRSGQLVNINSTVYYVSGSGLYGFPNAQTFYSWNYAFSQILPANTAEAALPVLGLVPTMQAGCDSPLNQINGTCSGATGGVSVGVLINKQGTVYLVGNSGLYGFPDLATFNSWGYSFSQIVAANAAEAALPVAGLVPLKNQNCGTPLNQIAGNCTPTPTPTAVPSPSPTPTPINCPNNAMCLPPPTLSAPAITSLSPNFGAVGSTVTIIGSGFTAANNTIQFGTGSFTANSSPNGTTLSFTIPNSLGPTCSPNTACPQYIMLVTPADYKITVTNSNGISNSVVYSVTSPPVAVVNNCQGIASSTGQCPARPTISSAVPIYGASGVQFTITGTGFTPSGNTATFASVQSTLSVPNIPSTNGTTLVLPAISQAGTTNCASNAMCAPIPFSSGNYTLTVSNSTGTSSNFYFAITK